MKSEYGDIKHYECIRECHAKPMTYGEWIGIKFPDLQQTHEYIVDETDERIRHDAPGYLVIFKYGEEGQNDGWEKKEQFEEAWVLHEEEVIKL